MRQHHAIVLDYGDLQAGYAQLLHRLLDQSPGLFVRFVQAARGEGEAGQRKQRDGDDRGDTVLSGQHEIPQGGLAEDAKDDGRCARDVASTGRLSDAPSGRRVYSCPRRIEALLGSAHARAADGGRNRDASAVSDRGRQSIRNGSPGAATCSVRVLTDQLPTIFPSMA
ncbi:hypothetical protein [Lysobacter gummosus]|uniref:hypothetical protein n=1 Tax=Lysobacter gummosus TaxID=262324 RepID=UPI00363A3AB6